MATVCDQGNPNQAAINQLLKEATRKYRQLKREPRRRIFEGDKEVIPLYDVPHLIKGIRNNLLTKNLHYRDGTNLKIARWQDILNTYKKDLEFGTMSSLPRITDNHVVPDKIHKMKVCYATQVLSWKMSRTMHLLAINPSIPEVPESAVGTAEIIAIFDELFDSLNGGKLKPHPGKKLRGGVTLTSGHLER